MFTWGWSKASSAFKELTALGRGNQKAYNKKHNYNLSSSYWKKVEIAVNKNNGRILIRMGLGKASRRKSVGFEESSTKTRVVVLE